MIKQFASPSTHVTFKYVGVVSSYTLKNNRDISRLDLWWFFQLMYKN